MNKIPIILSLLVCALFCQPAQASVHFVDAQLAEVSAMAARQGKLYFVHFTATWCMPCQWMEKNTFADSELGRYTDEHYLAVKLDIDQSEGLYYKKQYQITILPSILIFNAQGVLVDRIEESLDAIRFQERLQANDSPGNRLTGQQASTKLVASVLPSPKANMRLSRPALVPETSGTSVSYETPVPTTTTSPPSNYSADVSVTATSPESTPQASTSNFVHEAPKPIYINEPSWAPRSEKGYGIQVGVYSDYSNAIKKVSQLEQTFEVPINVYAQKQNDKMMYKIVVGLFASQSKAKQYLNYLNRNDLEGFVRNLDEF